jgi:hypothetical protein
MDRTDYSDCTKKDLVQEKKDIAKSPSFTANGIPVRLYDSYSPESGNVFRSYTFFITGYRVIVSTGYDIGEIYGAEYERRQSEKYPPSLSELVSDDIGNNFENPVLGIIAAHPNESEDMKYFFLQGQAMMHSMSAF